MLEVAAASSARWHDFFCRMADHGASYCEGRSKRRATCCTRWTSVDVGGHDALRRLASELPHLFLFSSVSGDAQPEFWADQCSATTRRSPASEVTSISLVNSRRSSVDFKQVPSRVVEPFRTTSGRGDVHLATPPQCWLAINVTSASPDPRIWPGI